jgi:hypothetical protein
MTQLTISVAKMTISMAEMTISMAKMTISMAEMTISIAEMTISMAKMTILITHITGGSTETARREVSSNDRASKRAAGIPMRNFDPSFAKFLHAVIR